MMHVSYRQVCSRIASIVGMFVFMLPVQAALPNDPNIEQWGFEDVHAYQAWEKGIDASDVVVAIIDNGFDSFHPDLAANVWKNNDEIPGNNIDDDKNGYIDDVYGWDFSGDGDNDPRPSVSDLTVAQRNQKIFHHGTVVAGIIGAAQNNGVGGAGVAPNVKLMNIRLLDEEGLGGFDYLGEAIRYAVDNGADVINMSLVSNANATPVKQAIDYAYAHNVAIVAAAGNNKIYLNEKKRYPICFDELSKNQKVLGVSAMAEPHILAFFSNYGSDCIDITAPGEGIVGTLRYAPRYGLTETFGEDWSGTSFSAPFVSGALALVKAIQPGWSVKELYAAVLNTTHKTPPENEAEYADLFGKGLLQIDRAVEYALAQVSKMTRATNIVAITADTGRKSIWSVGEKSKEESTHTLPQNISDIAPLQDDAGMFVTTAFDPIQKETTVALYNKDWDIQTSWAVASAGPLELAVAQVTGDDDTREIILSPTYAGEILFTIYTQSGVLLHEEVSDRLHDGVSLATAKEIGSDMYEIAVAYRASNGLQIRRFHGDGTGIGQPIAVTAIASRGALGAGDIDGDGAAEYVLTTARGTDPWITYYEANGTLSRKFAAYTFAYTGGFDIAVADYNGDGNADIITSPFQTQEPIRVWTEKAKKIAGWYAFDDSSDKQVLLLVQ